MKKLLIQAFDEPNHTQTPNKFFDMIPDMSEAELRVTLVMIRHTLGYHKNTFKMGMQKIGDASGLTRQGAIAGAEAAEKRGIFKRSNPDSIKEAEWELNLLPVNVDDMSTRITPSVNVDDSQCNLGLQQVGVKENYKENNKETNILFLKPTIKGIQAAMYADRPVTVDDLPLMELALTEFHAALSLPHNWNWYPAKTSDESAWRELREFVFAEWQKDERTFRKYATWRATPYVKGALSNLAIQRRPTEFITSWSDYLASSSMYSSNDQGFML